MCVGRAQSPESLTTVSSSGFIRLPPSCNSNYLEYIHYCINSKRIARWISLVPVTYWLIFRWVQAGMIFHGLKQ
ncbi:hypothetical protein DVQ95_15540 [Yersinia enterocolitica]|nr:hypothetical protein [Yersinia enterocolitica]